MISPASSQLGSFDAQLDQLDAYYRHWQLDGSNSGCRPKPELVEWFWSAVNEQWLDHQTSARHSAIS
ncbi:hypothetical protein CHU98_g8858 [Xylaria longipes]|nr:hypothetical protein CHU98_g8858 [Xylaria longipes]